MVGLRYSFYSKPDNMGNILALEFIDSVCGEVGVADFFLIEQIILLVSPAN